MSPPAMHRRLVIDPKLFAKLLRKSNRTRSRIGYYAAAAVASTSALVDAQVKRDGEATIDENTEEDANLEVDGRVRLEDSEIYIGRGG